MKKIFIKINGLQQGMFLQSENIQNPVLLFLHGEPGSPEIDFSHEHPTGLEKIYVLGHSWGTVLGMLTVQKVPELFHSYIGIGQVARQKESEWMAYTYMLEQFRAADNKKCSKSSKDFQVTKAVKLAISIFLCEVMA